MSERVCIIGAGGHAKTVIALLREANHTPVGALDDDASRWGRTILGVPVIGGINHFPQVRASSAVVAIGDNAARKAMVARLPDAPWISVVSPRAHVHPTVRIGVGSVVFEDVILQPDISIGDHVVLNPRCAIGHESLIGNFAHVAPNAVICGDCRVGEGALVGVGAVVVPSISVGAWATIAAGSSAMRHVPDGMTAIGVPARVVRGS